MNQAFRVFMIGSALALFCSTALADIPPPNACDTEGAACDTAGSGFDSSGTCKTQTCSRATPDGPMEYECKLCMGGAPGTDTGGSSSATGGSSSTTGGSSSATGGSSNSSDDSDDGCTFSGAAGVAHGSTGGLALVSAGLLWTLARRRAYAKAR